jgi:hypothetical protein
VVIAPDPIENPSILLQHLDQLAAVPFHLPPPKHDRDRSVRFRLAGSFLTHPAGTNPAPSPSVYKSR